MSTRVEGTTVLIMVTAHATLSAAPAHMVLSVREGILEQFAEPAEDKP